MRYVLLIPLALGLSTTASASLIFDSLTPVQGSGLGTVSTILTITSPGSSTTETGCVSYNGTSAVAGGMGCTGFPDSNVQNGASQIGTPLLSSVGITDANAIRIFFNAVEPSGNSITFEDGVLNLYNSSGGVIFTADYTGAPVTFDQTFSGTGASFGYALRLDAAQATTANTAITAAGGNARLGFGASLSQATGGPDTFFLFNAGGGSVPPSAIPEPMSMALLGSGLVALALVRRRVRS